MSRAVLDLGVVEEVRVSERVPGLSEVQAEEAAEEPAVPVQQTTEGRLALAVGAILRVAAVAPGSPGAEPPKGRPEPEVAQLVG